MQYAVTLLQLVPKDQLTRKAQVNNASLFCILYFYSYTLLPFVKD